MTSELYSQGLFCSFQGCGEALGKTSGLVKLAGHHGSKVIYFPPSAQSDFELSVHNDYGSFVTFVDYNHFTHKLFSALGKLSYDL